MPGIRPEGIPLSHMFSNGDRYMGILTLKMSLCCLFNICTASYILLIVKNKVWINKRSTSINQLEDNKYKIILIRVNFYVLKRSVDNYYKNNAKIKIT